MKSYQELSYERDRKSINGLCAAFAIAAALLWPASFAISGHGLAGEASWWNATETFSWIAAAVTSAGFGITFAVRLFLTPPIAGSNQ